MVLVNNFESKDSFITFSLKPSLSRNWAIMEKFVYMEVFMMVVIDQ